MLLIESLYKLKRDLIKFYKKYFTIEGTYTCILPDKIYLKKLYKQRTGKKLNLRNPKTFNEKQNWLKLYDRRPEYTVMVDKYKAREYIAEKIGEEYLVPLLGVWDSPDEIDFDALPNEFVLKCNHDNGVIICRDKSRLDIEKTKEELRYRLSRDYYKKLREWPYKKIKRKIVCEKYISEIDSDCLTDYKFHCFNGIPQYMYVVTTQNNETYLDYFDMSYKPLPIIHSVHPRSPENSFFSKPDNYEEMKNIAAKLSEGLPYVRVDLYNLSGKIYFGETTFFPTGGFAELFPEKWNLILGDCLKLPPKHRR
ncbi:MAG: glycosyl transferase [Clostridia bacterium]|nr:glycosyl transferase [Clostridia bacterium]